MARTLRIHRPPRRASVRAGRAVAGSLPGFRVGPGQTTRSTAARRPGTRDRRRPCETFSRAPAWRRTPPRTGRAGSRAAYCAQPPCPRASSTSRPALVLGLGGGVQTARQVETSRTHGGGWGLEEVRVATLERVHSLELLVVLAVDHLPRLLSPPEGGRIAERLLEVRVAEVRDESLEGSPLLTLD